MHGKSSLLVAGALHAFALSAYAQQQAEVGAVAPPVEVTAYRVPVLLTETTQGVTIVGSQEIQARKPASVVEVLQQVPGLYVDQVGSPGGVANVYIRGADPEQTLVLIDGVRMNDPMLSRGGSYDFSALDVSGIDRIEVIRGAGSALYGADAMGGVINIVTKRGAKEGISGTVGVGAGGRDYGEAHANVAGGTDKLQFAVNGAKLQDGRAQDGGTIDKSTFDGSLSFQPIESTDIKVFARRNERQSTGFPDASGGIKFAVRRTLERNDADETTYGANLSVRPLEQLGFKLQVSRYERNEAIDSPGVAPGVGGPMGIPASVSHSEFTRDTALISATARLPLSSDLTVGYERLEEDGVSRSVLDFGFPFNANFQLARNTDSTFAELKSKPIENLVTMLDLRYDRPSNLDSETSAGVGVRYDFVATGTAVKARYAEGFRPPSFYALASPLVGNPNLVSETSRSVEFGVEQILLNDRLQFGITAFRTRFKNLIDFDPGAGGPIGVGMLVNRNSVEAKGVETQVTLRPFDRLGITGSYTHVDTDIIDSPDNLNNRPRDRASLTLTYAVSDPWQVVLNTVYVGKFYDFSIPTGEIKADSYTRSDVAVSYKWQRLTATIAVDNVFDEKYQAFVGFEDPGVRVRGALSARF